MNYIALDLEWNQPAFSSETVAELTTEIIQIGAVKMNENFCVTDTFKANICPKFYPRIKQEVQQLTGISQEELENGLEFVQAAEQFCDWCGQNFALITWSHEDVPVLRKNLQVYQMKTTQFPDGYDLQIIYSLQQLGKYQQMALLKAMVQMGIEPELNAHDALHDAMYTAKLCGLLDMKQGIEQYEAYQKEAAKGRALATIVKQGYVQPEDAHQDSQLTEFVCPDCGFALKTEPWEKQKGTKRIAKAACDRHGAFKIRLRIQPRHNGTFRARAALYRVEENEK